MTRPLTAQIKPSTRNALMDQLAKAADEIILQRDVIEHWRAWEPAARAEVARAKADAATDIERLRISEAAAWACYTTVADLQESLLAKNLESLTRRRWWHRFAWWRK